MIILGSQAFQSEKYDMLMCMAIRFFLNSNSLLCYSIAIVNYISNVHYNNIKTSMHNLQ